MARLGRFVIGTLVCTAAVMLAAGPGAAATPSATTVRSIPRVGALFFPSYLGSALLLGLPHGCSASVVHSPQHDLVLTAAHCIVGNGVGYDFVPGYHDGVAPHGVWSAQHVYVDPAWIADRDPQHDYAFLQVAPKQWHGARHEIEDLTGAFTLGDQPLPGSTVSVDGYLTGVRDRPITCTSTVYDTDGFPSFDCGGFANGTSGGPWVRGAKVVGVIGGLHQGGCTPSTTYSAAFGADVHAVWTRAATHTDPDFVPVAGPDGCAAS
jgi:hypothetical protein